MNIRTIASICGVSPATVSRAINHPEMVRPEVLDRINETMREHGYRPAARTRQRTAQQPSRTLAVFIYDLENPFYTRMLRYLNRIAFDHNYTLIICETQGDGQRDVTYAKYIRDIHVSGIVLTDGILNPETERIIESIPAVSIDRLVSSMVSDVPIITSNHRQGSYCAVDHLVSLGHKRIAFAGLCDVYSSMSRFTAYAERVLYHSLSVNAHYNSRCEKMSLQAGYDAFDQFASLKEPPTAVVCVNDILAYGIIKRAGEAGVCVPEQLSIVGCDGVYADIFYPSLTTIKQDIELITKTAANMLFEIIDGNKGNGAIIPVTLIEGSTTARCSETRGWSGRTASAQS
ncbi:MAG: LacI family DNA-binding transcriptional regulator [Christensenellales bacterium]|jgi:LacI family repressor for deo operon, udp, cdd, tsx, nupC, and nupG